MAVFNAAGLPVQLFPVLDRNFSDLAATLTQGQSIRGRVTEIFPDGRAVVNFRGIPVTAELKGVSLERGEVIQVAVRELKGTPTFQLLRGTAPGVAAPGVAAPGVPASVAPVAGTPATPPLVPAGLDPVTVSQLRDLGLPSDGFHASMLELMQDYGVPVSRESVVAVKEMVARLVGLLGEAVAPERAAAGSTPRPAVGTPQSARGGEPPQAVAPPRGSVEVTLLALPADEGPQPGGQVSPWPGLSSPVVAEVASSLSEAYLAARLGLAPATREAPVANAVLPETPFLRSRPEAGAPAAVPLPTDQASRLSARPSIRWVEGPEPPPAASTVTAEPAGPVGTPETVVPAGRAEEPVRVPLPGPRVEPEPATVPGQTGATGQSAGVAAVRGARTLAPTAPSTPALPGGEMELRALPVSRPVEGPVLTAARGAIQAVLPQLPAASAPVQARAGRGGPEPARVPAPAPNRGDVRPVLAKAVETLDAMVQVLPPRTPGVARLVDAARALADSAAEAASPPAPGTPAARVQPQDAVNRASAVLEGIRNVLESPDPVVPAELTVLKGISELAGLATGVIHDAVASPPGRALSARVLSGPAPGVAVAPGPDPEVRVTPGPAPAVAVAPGLETAPSVVPPVRPPAVPAGSAEPALPGTIAVPGGETAPAPGALTAPFVGNAPVAGPFPAVSRQVPGPNPADAPQSAPLTGGPGGTVAPERRDSPQPTVPFRGDPVPPAPSSPQPSVAVRASPSPEPAGSPRVPVPPPPANQQTVPAARAPLEPQPLPARAEVIDVPGIVSALVAGLRAPARAAGEMVIRARPAPVPSATIRSAPPPVHTPVEVPMNLSPVQEAPAPAVPVPEPVVAAVMRGSPLVIAPQVPATDAANAPAVPPSGGAERVAARAQPAGTTTEVPATQVPVRTDVPRAGETPGPVIARAVAMTSPAVRENRPVISSLSEVMVSSAPARPAVAQTGTAAGREVPSPAQAVPQGAPAAATLSPRLIETAVFMHGNALPARPEMAKAAHEFLFGESRISQALEGFEASARAVPERTMPAPLREAVESAMKTLDRLRVKPEGEGLAGRLKAAVEEMGLSHEAVLNRAAAEPKAPGRRDAPPGIREARNSLKAAMLGVQREAGAALPALPAPEGREAIGRLADSARDVLQVVQAQQLGGVPRPGPESLVYVQIPLVPGMEIRAGEMQVSWRKEKQSRKRDPRTPADMTLKVETRALGPVAVSMRLLGQSLSLIFRVFDSEIQDFIRKELPDLVSRLTGFKLKVDKAVCEFDQPPAPEPAGRAVPPTSSLDLSA